MSVWLQSRARRVRVWLVVMYGLKSFVLAQPLLELVPCLVGRRRELLASCCLVGRRRELLASCLLAL